MQNVVLLNGAWHGAWCWNLITARLAARGIPAVAVDLEGHGLAARSPEARWSSPFDPAAFATEPSPVADVTASSAASLFVEQLRTIGGGGPSLVVAHSMAGPVATLAAEQAPELFAHLMFVSAITPVSGHSGSDYFFMPESEGALLPQLFAADPSVVGAFRVNTTDQSGHAQIRKTFYADVEQPVADAAIALLTPDAPVGIPGETFAVTPERFGAVPHSYVVCTEDYAISPALQRRMVREIDCVSSMATKVFEMASSHSPFLSRPDELTEAIAAIR